MAGAAVDGDVAVVTLVRRHSRRRYQARCAAAMTANCARASWRHALVSTAAAEAASRRTVAHGTGCDPSRRFGAGAARASAPRLHRARECRCRAAPPASRSLTDQHASRRRRAMAATAASRRRVRCSLTAPHARGRRSTTRRESRGRGAGASPRSAADRVATAFGVEGRVDDMRRHQHRHARAGRRRERAPARCLRRLGARARRHGGRSTVRVGGSVVAVAGEVLAARQHAARGAARAAKASPQRGDACRASTAEGTVADAPSCAGRSSTSSTGAKSMSMPTLRELATDRPRRTACARSDAGASELARRREVR